MSGKDPRWSAVTRRPSRREGGRPLHGHARSRATPGTGHRNNREPRAQSLWDRSLATNVIGGFLVAGSRSRVRLAASASLLGREALDDHVGERPDLFAGAL